MDLRTSKKLWQPCRGFSWGFLSFKDTVKIGYNEHPDKTNKLNSSGWFDFPVITNKTQS